jgi:hypothetical protein
MGKPKLKRVSLDMTSKRDLRKLLALEAQGWEEISRTKLSVLSIGRATHVLVLKK